MDFIRCRKNGESENSLAGANGSGRRGPIGRNEIDTPEMRSGREKFNANALAFLGCIAEEHDSAFLLFLREWIGENDHAVHSERLIEVHQTAVGVDDDRLAGFAETAVVGVFSRDNHAHAHEDSGTASTFVEFRLWHCMSMLPHIELGVNGAVAGVFPLCNRRLLISPRVSFLALEASERVMIPQNIRHLVHSLIGGLSFLHQDKQVEPAPIERGGL